MTPRKSLTRLLTAALCAAVTAPAAATAGMDVEPRALERPPAGVLTEQSLPPGYSHVVVVAWPRLQPGQQDSIPAATAKFAQMFGSVILAGVSQDPATGRHHLDRVAIGHTMRDGQQVLIVTPKSDRVGLLAKQVLSAGERELDKIRQIARYDTAVLIESPAVMLRGGVHQVMKARHFIWTSAAQGGLASVVWMVDDSGAAPQVVNGAFVRLPPGFRDDRLLSVDPKDFSFIGTPGPTAFAMVRLPAGVAVPASDELLRLAAAPSYNTQTLPRLAQALATAVANSD